MLTTRRLRLLVELLETRDVPDATPTTATLPPPPTTSGITIIDPTLSPSDPLSNSFQVTVTGVGPTVNGQVSSVTVTGLTASTLKPGASFQVVLGGNTYTVTAVS